MRDIKLLVIHCAATRDGEPCSVAAIDAWHKARGFDAGNGVHIGYHYVIDVDGAVYPGRREDQVGAHAAGYNAHSLGVCLVGGITGHGRYTTAQWDALRDLVDRLRKKYAIPSIVGHRDLPDVHKACPSFDVAAWLDRGMVADPAHIFTPE